jgi:hypothetical protein
MPRRLLLVVLALLVPALAPAVAQAGWFPAEPVDGPSADIVSVDDVDVARDGTGVLVWRRLVDGVPHVFISRLSGGTWRPAERVDAPIPEGADVAAAGVADGGRLAVAWVSGGRVFGVSAAAGPSLQPLVGPTLLQQSPDGAPSSGLDVSMGINGTAYAVWRASGGGGADVLAARLKGDAWNLLPAPLDIAPSNPAGVDTGRPRVAVDAAGTGLAAWSEAGGVFARRLLGTSTSQYPQQVSLPDLGTADLPEVDVEEDGSFGWVAFRQLDQNGPRALARRIRGLQFEVPSTLDTGPGAGPPAVSISGRGAGAAAVPVGSGDVLTADVSGGDAFSGPGRLNTEDGEGLPDVGVFGSDSRDTVVAWRRDSGDGVGAVIARYRPAGQPWESEVTLSRQDFGPVAAGSLHVAGTRNGDAAVAMLQGTPSDRRVAVAYYDLPPGRAFPGRGWVRESQPALGWSGGLDIWGVQGYQVLIDGAVAGETGERAFRPGAPLPDGEHTLQVVTVDRRGQAVPSGVRKFRIDTVVPTATLQVTGRLRRDRPVTVQVAAADVGSGVGSVRVDYGDGTRRGRKATTVHAYAQRGRYVLTARVRDVAGNETTATATIRVRK